MQLDYVLWMYILVFFVILFGLMVNNSSLIHAIFFALIVTFLFLLIVKPPADVLLENDNIACIFIYYAIIFISSISILLYAGVLSYKNLHTIN